MNNRDEMIKHMKNILEKMKPKETRKALQVIIDQHNIESSDIFNYLTLREDLEVAPTEILFIILEQIDENSLQKYFDIVEINKFKSLKMPIKEKFHLPYIIGMQQVNFDQWIGAIKVSILNELGDANMLRYNENTQRPMQFVHNGTVEYYRPYTNKNALKKIEEAFLENRYIPNTITLNMPEDSVFQYDPDAQELNIKHIDHFDILDGYHRYRTISKIHNENPSWDYPMELRIVSFQESKAKQFIYQEDQKTKMSKVASNAMNSAAEQNKIVAQLNEDSGFVLNGLINMNNGIINAGELAAIIGKCWYTKQYTSVIETAKMNAEIRKKLKKGITKVIETDEDRLTTKWDRQFLFAVVKCIKENVDLSLVNELSERFKQEGVFSGTYITSPDIKKVNRIMKEVIGDDVQ